MQNHFHTDAVQIGVTALGVLVLFHFVRALSAQMVDSKQPLIAALGKGAAGLVTFSA